ncbi:MAG: hypothetical protein ABW148_11255 [Sedimenticola sp.]
MNIRKMRTLDNRYFTPCRLAYPLFVIAMALSGSVHAYEWTLDPTLSADLMHTDNLQMSVTNKQSDTRLQIRPTLTATAEDETEVLSVNGGLVIERYDQAGQRDRNDPFLSLSWDRFQEQTTYGLDASFRQEATLTSEEEDSGILNVSGEKRSFSVSPHWTGEVDDKNSITVSGSASDVSYDIASFTDRRDYNITAAWNHELDAQRVINYKASATANRPDSVDADSNYYGLTVGITQEISELMSFNVSGGLSHVAPETGNSTNGYLFDAGVNRQGQYDSVGAGFVINLSPSSLGTVRENYRLNLNYSRELTPYTSFTFAANASRSKTAGDNGSSENTSYSIQPGLKWQLNEELSLNASYRYRRSELGSVGDSAVANSIQAAIQYSPKY